MVVSRTGTAGSVGVRETYGPAALGSIAAACLALYGVREALFGGGRLVVFGPVAGEAWRTIAAVSVVWLTVGVVAKGRPLVIYGSALLAGLALVATTADDVGRSPAAVALLGVIAARACLVDWQPLPRWPQRTQPVAWAALVPVLLGQLWWLQLDGSSSLAVAALASIAAVAACEAYARRPDRAAALEAPFRRGGSTAARVTAQNGRRGAAWLRREVPAAWARARRWFGGLHVRWGSVLVALAVGLAWAPALWRLEREGDAFTVMGVNDFPLHLQVADTLSYRPLTIESPHLLYHVATAFWRPLLGLEQASLLVLVVAIAASVLAMEVLVGAPFRDGTRLPRAWASTTAAAFFFLETPELVLVALGLASERDPFFTVNWWGNPTWLMGLPFLLLTFPTVERATAAALAADDERDDRPLRRDADRRVAVAAVVLAVGALAKPTITLCLLPVLPFYLLLVRRLRWWATVRLCLVIEAPMALVVLWQTWFLANSSDSRFSSGWVVDPIVQPLYGWGAVGPIFLLPLWLVVLAAVLTRGSYFRERGVQLVLCCTVVALPLMLFVNETGERAHHGNFAVPMQACATMLVVFAIRSLARVAWEGQPRWQRVVVAVAAAAFALGGVLSWLDGAAIYDLGINWDFSA